MLPPNEFIDPTCIVYSSNVKYVYSLYIFFLIIYKFISIYKNYTLFLILNYYEAIKSILFQQSLHIQNSFFFFFHFSMFTFFIITENPRKVFFRKYRYLNSLSNAIHPIQIRRAVFEKLRFEIKVKKILTSKIPNSEIYGPIM